MTEYQPSRISPEYAIEVWTDDLRLIARTGPTNETTARTDLAAIQCGMPLARLVVRDHPQGEWHLAEQAADTVEVAA